MDLPAQVDESESIKRNRRKGSYHILASKNRLPSDPDDQEDDYMFKYLMETSCRKENLLVAKRAFLGDIATSGGDTTTASFQRSLEQLVQLSPGERSFDASRTPSKSSQSPKMEGMWILLSKPQFSDSIGRNEHLEQMYTLGRMSFNMFGPCELVCSIQGCFNPVHRVRSKDIASVEPIPDCFKDEIRQGNSVMRTYDTVTAFAIEPANPAFGPDSPNRMVDKRIEGLMTTKGYAISNPKHPDRLSVWFTGGSLEVNEDTGRWKQAFASETLPKPRGGRLLKARSKIGATSSYSMEGDGKMSYHLKKPVAGHDFSFVEIIFMDETIRVMRANTGVIYVSARIPYFPDE